jgi:hypothetical protein
MIEQALLIGAATPGGVGPRDQLEQIETARLLNAQRLSLRRPLGFVN